MLPTEQTTTAVPHVNTSSACAGVGMLEFSFAWCREAAWHESPESSGELLRFQQLRFEALVHENEACYKSRTWMQQWCPQSLLHRFREWM